MQYIKDKMQFIMTTMLDIIDYMADKELAGLDLKNCVKQLDNDFWLNYKKNDKRKK